MRRGVSCRSRMENKMTNRLVRPGILILLILLQARLLSYAEKRNAFQAQGAPTCGPHCGTERWKVKTLSDSDAAQVSLNDRKIVTIHTLVTLEPPHPLPPDNRIPPVELTTFGVQARLLGFKLESDRDFHIVIGDPQTHETMIVEIPNPKCDGVCASRALNLITQARQTFVQQCGTPTAKFAKLVKPIDVKVTGVGFFDFAHGQTGVAKNAIELHPVLRIELPDQTDDCARHIAYATSSGKQ